MLTNTSVTSDRTKEASESSPSVASAPAAPTRRGWLARVRKAFGGGGDSAAEPASGRQGKAPGSNPSSGEIRSMTQHLIGEDRYVFVLLDEFLLDLFLSVVVVGLLLCVSRHVCVCVCLRTLSPRGNLSCVCCVCVLCVCVCVCDMTIIMESFQLFSKY